MLRSLDGTMCVRLCQLFGGCGYRIPSKGYTFYYASWLIFFHSSAVYFALTVWDLLVPGQLILHIISNFFESYSHIFQQAYQITFLLLSPTLISLLWRTAFSHFCISMEKGWVDHNCISFFCISSREFHIPYCKVNRDIGERHF